MTEQATLPDAFPEKNAALERLAVKRIAAEAKKRKAEDELLSTYDAAKEILRDEGLDEYRCYGVRYAWTASQRDLQVKLKPLKEAEPSPYAPAQKSDD